MERPYSDIIYRAAEQYRINPLFIAAIILQESAGDPFAMRLENGFFRRYLKDKTAEQLKGHVPELISLPMEKLARSTSWGLMQIMGNTAREAGFDNADLSDLTDPETNIFLGAKIFANLMLETKEAIKALSRWNGGANLDYPHEVLDRIDSNETDKILAEMDA